MITAEGIVYTDNTIHKATARCSTQTVVEHILGLKGEGDRAPLRQGQDGHAALAGYFKSIARGVAGPAAIGYALEIYDHAYKNWAEEHVHPADRLSWQNSRDIIENWLQTRHGKFPFRVEHESYVEVGFSVPLDDSGQRYDFGRADLIATWIPTNEIIIVDHKFSGGVRQPWWPDQFRRDTQVSGYLWAAQHHFPSVRGFLVNAIEMSKLPNSDRQCSKHSRPFSQCRLTEPREGVEGHWTARYLGPYTRTPEQLEAWRLDALAQTLKYEQLAATYGDINNIDYVRTNGRFITDACKWCGLKDWCDLGRPVEQVKTMLVYDPWMPFDPREVGKAG